MLGDMAGFVEAGPPARRWLAAQGTAPAQLAGFAPPQAVLIASTTWWAFPARLALACRARGFAVYAVCAAGHPLHKTAAVSGVFAYDAVRPLGALQRAIAQSGAALVLPCDDRARAHLHRLFAADNASPALRQVIRDSLGDPAGFACAERRPDVIALAREAGIAAPLTVKLSGPASLEAALLQTGLPAVLKVDGTWGGWGVAVVRNREQAEAAFRRLSRPLSLLRATKRVLADRDAFDLPALFAREKPRLSLQGFVDGRPANSLSVCRDGQVLGTIAAEALVLQRPHGAAAVVRLTEHEGMRRAADILARRLGIGGFMGLDFLIDARGTAHLIELNARATPLSHFCLGDGRDLVGALARIARLPASQPAPLQAPGGVVAYFPQAWHTDPGAPWLHEGFHDVPWEDPELVRELMRLPRPDRGPLARLLRALRRGPAEFPGASA